MSLEGFYKQSFLAQANNTMQSIKTGTVMMMWLALVLAVA